jgi:hypothetical protein
MHERDGPVRRIDWYRALPKMRMTLAEFERLPEYSASYPTGTTPGKMWRRHDGAHDPSRRFEPLWVICQYDPDCPDDAKTIKILSYRPVIRMPARRAFHAY